MKNTISIFLFIISGINFCYSQDSVNEKPIEVSLEKLIQNPTDFDKRYITINGYTKFEKKGNRIFISKEELDNNDVKKSILFMFMIESSTYKTVKECDKKYVVLTGFYISDEITDDDGKLISKGVITSVLRIKPNQ